MLTLHYYCKSKGIILICFSLIQYLLLANFTFYLIQNIFSLLKGNEFIQTPATQHSNNFTNNVKGGREVRTERRNTLEFKAGGGDVHSEKIVHVRELEE